MKNTLTKQPQLVTRVIYLIPLLLVYTVAVCIAHVLASETEVTLANIANAKQTVHPAYTATVKTVRQKPYNEEKIESFHEILRRIANADATRSLRATRESVLAELRKNTVTPLYAIERDHNNPQRITDDDGEKSLAATRNMVLATLKDNVNDLFHNRLQYPGNPNADKQRIAGAGVNDQILPYEATIKIADKLQ